MDRIHQRAVTKSHYLYAHIPLSFFPSLSLTHTFCRSHTLQAHRLPEASSNPCLTFQILYQVHKDHLHRRQLKALVVPAGRGIVWGPQSTHEPAPYWRGLALCCKMASVIYTK